MLLLVAVALRCVIFRNFQNVSFFSCLFRLSTIENESLDDLGIVCICKFTRNCNCAMSSLCLCALSVSNCISVKCDFVPINRSSLVRRSIFSGPRPKTLWIECRELSCTKRCHLTIKSIVECLRSHFWLLKNLNRDNEHSTASSHCQVHCNFLFFIFVLHGWRRDAWKLEHHAIVIILMTRQRTDRRRYLMKLTIDARMWRRRPKWKWLASKCSMRWCYFFPPRSWYVCKKWTLDIHVRARGARAMLNGKWPFAWYFYRRSLRWP